MTPPVVLSIAGSDSGGGAGIQADLKTFAAFGVHGTTAVTAVTAQNTAEVRSLHPLPVAVVREQIDAVLDDLVVRAVKTGMLATAATVELVAEAAAAGRLPKLVVDPVMVSSTGTRLLEEAAERLYLESLLPAASVFTPNLLEAGVLLGTELVSSREQRLAAVELAARTKGIVVVKGGHATSDAAHRAIDAVAVGTHCELLVDPRVDTANNHGSGCSFASAIAAGLALGAEPTDAIAQAKHFVHRAIAGGARWRLGSGHGPLDHLSASVDLRPTPIDAGRAGARAVVRERSLRSPLRSETT